MHTDRPLGKAFSRKQSYSPAPPGPPQKTTFNIPSLGKRIYRDLRARGRRSSTTAKIISRRYSYSIAKGIYPLYNCRGYPELIIGVG